MQHLEVRKRQTVKGTVDGGLSVLSILTAGGTDIISEGVQPVLLSYDLIGDFTTVPDGPRGTDDGHERERVRDVDVPCRGPREPLRDRQLHLGIRDILAGTMMGCGVSSSVSRPTVVLHGVRRR